MNHAVLFKRVKRPLVFESCMKCELCRPSSKRSEKITNHKVIFLLLPVKIRPDKLEEYKLLTLSHVFYVFSQVDQYDLADFVLILKII